MSTSPTNKLIGGLLLLAATTFVFARLRQPASALGQPADSAKALDRKAQAKGSPYAGTFAGKGAYAEPRPESYASKLGGSEGYSGVVGGRSGAAASAAAAARDYDMQMEEDLILGVLAGGT